ncbi:hypothetical protein [Tsukamurella sp. PLM1]|uniref:hypothetical protein n=1 Tax=Tsukamurella sp. PLM1 TaxID=2929795 RepID=UPI0020BE76FE|nr:hypothetical protein [Tsukamurella sp. PLM1]
MIAGGDIAAAMADSMPPADLAAITLRPDDLAETVWRLVDERSAPEAVIDVIS